MARIFIQNLATSINDNWLMAYKITEEGPNFAKYKKSPLSMSNGFYNLAQNCEISPNLVTLDTYFLLCFYNDLFSTI